MTAEQCRSVEAWFDRLADVPLDEAETKLHSHCDDPDVRSEVLRLIRSTPHSDTASMHVREQLGQFAESLGDYLPGTKIGDYELLERIGAGGMGSIYRARQDLTHQIVALKLIRAGVLAEHVVRRFMFEVETLGRLNHPGIARVYEAGLADTGRGRQPFFAMELIEGVPLDTYAAGHKLTLHQRVEMLRRIADAVAHAHGRGVIHRDLKPANILVQADGQPKVVDFGIARAVTAGAERITLTSEAGQLIGTPAYMAPEQVAGHFGQIDPDTDVYALGVIGFELLCGRKPYGVTGKPLHEITRTICEREPPRPSAVQRALRGDIETILLKSLEKDKSRRYPTAAELAEDLRRVLAHEPITARPASRGYRLRKFIRRNRGPVAAALVIVTALLAGLGATAWGLVRAERQRVIAESERDNSEAVVRFLTRDVLAAADPAQARGHDVTVKEAIDKAAGKVGERFRDRPLVEAAVRRAISDTYRSLGRDVEALPHLQIALELRRKHLGMENPETLGTLGRYGNLLVSLGRFAEAEPHLREVIERYRAVRGPDHPDTVMSVANLSALFLELGRFDEAEPLMRQVLEQHRRRLGEDHRLTITAMSNYGVALMHLDRFAQAEPVLRQAYAQRLKHSGSDDPLTLLTASSLANALRYLGRFDEAESLFRETLANYRRVLGEDHHYTLRLMQGYADFLHNAARLPEAEQLLRQTLEKSRTSLGPDHPDTLRCWRLYAGVLHKMGRSDEAEVMYRDVLERLRQVLGEDHHDTLGTLGSYAGMLRAQGRAAEAEPLGREALERRERRLGAKHRLSLEAAAEYAAILSALGRNDESSAIRAAYPVPATAPSAIASTRPDSK